MTNEKIIEAARGGDQMALDRLLSAIQPDVTRMVRRYIRSEIDADDVVQETLVKIYQHIDSFRGDGAFAGWALRIARNCALMHLRREKRRPEFQTEKLALLFADERTPYHDVSGRQELAQAWEAIQTLEPKYRRALELRVGQGLSMSELGGALGLSAAGAKTRLFRAREYVRVQMAA